MSLSKSIVTDQSHVTQFLGLILPQSTVQPGGGKRTWFQVTCFEELVILRCQVGWPGDILKVTVFRPKFSPAQGALSSLEATWEVAFPLAVGLQSRFYPATIGSHHGEVLLLTTFRVETKEWKEYVPGVGSVVREEHEWTNGWIPVCTPRSFGVFTEAITHWEHVFELSVGMRTRFYWDSTMGLHRGELVVLVDFTAVQDEWVHDIIDINHVRNNCTMPTTSGCQTLRCQMRAMIDGSWWCEQMEPKTVHNMWKASWVAPTAGSIDAAGVTRIFTGEFYQQVRIGMTAGSEKENSEEAIGATSDAEDDDSDFEIIESSE